jgi:hypothetical protein
MKPIGLLVVLVGCGAKPAEPLSTPPPIAHPAIDKSVELRPVKSEIAGTRPKLDIDDYVPDVAEYGRWPLTISEHPSLEPHFNIAEALAEPGVSWTDLCARGAQHRHLSSKQELVDYLDAWCNVAADDFRTAITKLGDSRRAKTVGVTRALRLDVASIAAAHGSAHDLESFLRSGGFLNVEEVDLVAAAYDEVGALDDAEEANRLAITMDYTPTEPMMCKRMLRAIADTKGTPQGEAIAALQERAKPLKGIGEQTPRCVAEYAEVQCWRGAECYDYWVDRWIAVTGSTRSVGVGVRILVSAYHDWPAEPQFGSTWLSRAIQLDAAWPPGDKFKLLLPELDLALRASNCETELLDAIDSYAFRLDDQLDKTVVANPLGMRHDGQPHVDLDHLEAATTKQVIDHLARVRTEGKQLLHASGAECVERIAQLPAMTP